MSDCSNWRGDQIKATVEQEFRESRSEDLGARSVRGRQPERMLRVIAETTERVDVFRMRRVRTCLSLSVNKINPSLHEPTLSASFLPSELCYSILTPIVSILSLRMGSFSFLPIRLVSHLAFLKTYRQ